VEIPDARNQIFNIGGDTPYSLRQLAETVLAVTGARNELRFLPARKEVLHAFSDHGKAARVFGSQSFTSLSDGLTRMWAWAQKHGPRKSPKFAGIEVDRELPAFWRED
jgi:UDP-glucose 4-epimerase